MSILKGGLIFVSLIFAVHAAPSEDLITSLPGLKSLPAFKQYSGYLDASPTKHFHYWFTESQRDPSSDPVVLWLNGGPGCSSLDGLLSENGPIHVNNDGNTLYMNPYAWNKLANVIYMESPAGVGYSYDDHNHVRTNDTAVAKHNYAALQHFFKKFPEYAKNEFYVTGESYGGIYIPTLAYEIIKGKQFNFKAFAVGNGLGSYRDNDDSLVFFAYFHGLFGETLKNNLVQSCCKGSFTRESCSFHNAETNACSNCVQEVFTLVYRSGLNEYALYLDCEGSNSRSIAYRFTMDNLFRNLETGRRAQVFSQKMLSSQPRLGEDPPCTNSTALRTWLGKPEVREALHIPKGLPGWDICSKAVSMSYVRVYQDVTPVYKKILANSDVRILIYNGDTDMACNFLGDQWFVSDLGLAEVHARKPWYVKSQVAGFAREFKRLRYTTIRGAGHMVPQWAPEYSYSMFEKFLKDEPFTR